MQSVVYPVLGSQTCLPFYLSGIGIAEPEYHVVRDCGLVSHQILYTKEGEGYIHVEGQQYHAVPGNIFYIAPGIPHEYFPVDGQWTTCWTVFRGDYLEMLMKRMGFPEYVCKDTADISVLERGFGRLLAAAASRAGGQEACSGLLYEYIMNVRSILFSGAEAGAGGFVEQSLVYMDAHYPEDISLEELSGLCQVSKQHFCRVFKEKIGMRPMEYLARKRILEAKVLLCGTNASVGEIGQSVGYNDLTYFGMVFKKYEGVSPSEFRKTRMSVVL